MLKIKINKIICLLKIPNLCLRHKNTLFSKPLFVFLNYGISFVKKSDKMTAIARMPITANRLKKQLENEDIIFVPATIEEYWKLVESPQLRLDYFSNQIVATMSYGSIKHERIVNNVIFRLNLQFGDENCETFPSNRPVYAADCENIFNPDVHFVQGELKTHFYKRTKTATANPAIIVEVMSESTKEFDLISKLPCYQKMGSVQHIVYIEQDYAEIMVYSRTNKSNEWLLQRFNLMTDTFNLLNKSFSLKDIYRNICF
jgi:Uma2 family endonuclease